MAGEPDAIAGAASLREKTDAVSRSRERNAKGRVEAQERMVKLGQLIEGSADEVKKREVKALEAKTDITRLLGDASAAGEKLTGERAEF